jgi:hypothetical protein
LSGLAKTRLAPTADAAHVNNAFIPLPDRDLEPVAPRHAKQLPKDPRDELLDG